MRTHAHSYTNTKASSWSVFRAGLPMGLNSTCPLYDSCIEGEQPWTHIIREKEKEKKKEKGIERHTSFNQRESFEEDASGINSQINWIYTKVKATMQARRKKSFVPSFCSPSILLPSSPSCVCVCQIRGITRACSGCCWKLLAPGHMCTTQHFIIAMVTWRGHTGRGPLVSPTRPAELLLSAV